MSNRTKHPTGLGADGAPAAPSRSVSPALLVLLAVGVVIAIAAGVAIAFSGGGDDEVVDASGQVVADPIESAEIAIDGDALPRLDSMTDDPAIGMPAPEMIGLSYTGEQFEIPFDGRAKAVVFLAHWCPHCQNELPQLVSWLDAGGLPDDVDLYVVATATDSGQPNYPPSAWFEREGLTGVPVIMDDGDSTAAAAMGLPGYPYWVAIDKAGLVTFRASGELPTVLGRPADEAFDFVMQSALAGAAA